MGVAATNPDKKLVYKRCEEAMAMCKSLDTALVGMCNRLIIDMPVNATMTIIEGDLRSLNERIEALRRAIPEDEEITVEV
jgi:hypothetical protein